MSKIILLSLIGLGIVTSFSFIYSVKKEFKIVEYSEIEGSEQLESKMIDFKDFHSIEVSDQMRVILSQGDYSVEVLAEENLLDHVSVKNNDGFLEIRKHIDNSVKIKQNLPMVVKVSAPEYKSIKGRRQSEVIIDDSLEVERLTLNLSAQSNFKGELLVKELDLVMKQQSNASIYGSADVFRVSLSEQTGVRATSFKSKVVNVNLENQCEASLYAEVLISGFVRGNAGLLVEGGPEKRELEESKNSEVRFK